MYSHQNKPLDIKNAITSGNAGVTQPGANGSPKIIGPDVIKKLAIKHTATACMKVKPKASTTGAPARAVAPEIIKPCEIRQLIVLYE